MKFINRLARASAVALLLACMCGQVEAQIYEDTGSSKVPAVVPILPGVGPIFGSATPGKVNCVTGCAGITSFLSAGHYVNVPSVTTTANHALTSFVGPNALLKNYGTTQIAIHQAASSTTVTVATADAIIDPGGTWEVALGTGTNIAAASVVSGAISGTGSLQIIDGSGLWTGSGGGSAAGSGSGSSASVSSTGTTAPTSADLGGVIDSGGNLQGVSAANPQPTTITNTVTVANPAMATAGSSFPASQAGIGGNGNGLIVPIAQSGASVPINISSATTQQLVGLVSGKTIYVTSWDIISGGTTNFTFVYGTGSNCASGTTALTGPYGLVAQFGEAKGSGLGAVLVVPVGNALCGRSDTGSVQISGSLSYSQF